MKHKNIYLILIVAFLVRLIALNQSLWLDEATTAQTIKHFSFAELIFKFAPTDFHPPLYYLFMKVWSSIFGYSEIVLRMPSVIFSLLTGWVVYQIGKKLQNEITGLWAAAFFLFNPLIIYYSQEARMYLMATFLLTAALYYLILYLKFGLSGNRSVILFNICVALSLLTFYGSIFLITGIYLTLIIFLAFKKNSKVFLPELIKFLPGAIIALALLSPLLYRQYMHSREMLSLIPHWSMVLGKANIKNLLLIPIKFSIGRIQFEPKMYYYLGAGLWTMFVFLYIVLGGIKNRLLGWLFVAPLVLGFVFSFFTPLLQYFRFIYLIPLYALLMVLGISEKYRRAMYLAVFVLTSFIYLLLPRYHRENWKVLAQTIKPDVPVYMIYSSSDPLQYYLNAYNNKADIKDLKQISGEKKKMIVVVPYTSDIHGVSYKDILIKKGYKNIITFNTRELSSEVWEKK